MLSDAPIGRHVLVHLSALLTEARAVLIKVILRAMMLNPVNTGGEVDGGLHGLILYTLYVDAFGGG